jgi:hypothetical protein
MTQDPLSRVNPKFREITDLLLFSDRMDLDLSDYKRLLRENYNDHFDYLLDRFSLGSEVCWEIGAVFWENRLTFLFSLNEKKISTEIETYLESRVTELFRSKDDVSPVYDVEFLQFIELCKVKKNNCEPLNSIRTYLTESPPHMKFDKLIGIVEAFIPIVFEDMNEFAEIIGKRITNSIRNFDLLMELESRGIVFDKQPILNLARELIVERTRSDKNLRAFFIILNNDEIRARLKDDYSTSYREKILDLLDYCDYSLIEEFHLRNMKNLVELDLGLADELAVIYADKLYSRSTSHKKANADRLIRLLKTIPQIYPKKILAYLSANNKMFDIKYMLTEFPDLKKLAAFV